MKLYVEERTWNGRVLKYESKVIKREYELEKDVNNIININGELSALSAFIITEIDDDFIIIETNIEMCKGEDEFFCGESYTSFRIEKSKKIFLYTPTLDFGYKYVFELKN